MESAAEKWCIQKGLEALGCKEEGSKGRVEWEWARKALHTIPLTKQERGGLRATMDGAAWTEARMFEAGYLQFGDCACGFGVGDTPHRLLDCHKHEEERGTVSKKVLDAANIHRNDRVGRLRVSRLIPIRTAETVPSPQEEVIITFSLPCGHNMDAHDGVMIEEDHQEVTEGLSVEGVQWDTERFGEEVRAQSAEWGADKAIHGELPFTGTVFTDGSAVDGNGGRFTRVGAAVVQLTGNVLWEDIMGFDEGAQSFPTGARGIVCCVPGERQSSSDGELFAIEALVKRAKPPLCILTDYKLAVDGFRKGRRWCTAADKLQACRWRRIWEVVKSWPPNSIKVVHVKAHRRAEAVTEGGDKVIWLGNFLADATAKAAAKYRQVDSEVIAGFKQDQKQYFDLARLAAKVMTKCAEERPWKKEGKRWETYGEERAVKAGRRKHALYRDDKGHTRCAFCTQFAATDASRKKMSYMECKGPLIGRLGVGIGHRLWRSRDEGGGAKWWRRMVQQMWRIRWAGPALLSQTMHGANDESGKEECSILV